MFMVYRVSGVGVFVKCGGGREVVGGMGRVVLGDVLIMFICNNWGCYFFIVFWFLCYVWGIGEVLGIWC